MRGMYAGHKFIDDNYNIQYSVWPMIEQNDNNNDDDDDDDDLCVILVTCLKTEQEKQLLKINL